MSARRDEAAERELFAWLDDELGPLARRRAGRRIARDPQARAAAEFWQELRARLREEAREGPEPDLWPELRRRLPEAPPADREAPPADRKAPSADREAPAPVRAAPFGAMGRRGPAWIGAGLAAAAAAALALAVWLPWRDPPAAGSVRWLDTAGQPAIVLQDDAEATIIWVLDSGAEQSRLPEPRRRGGHGAVG